MIPHRFKSGLILSSHKEKMMKKKIMALLLACSSAFAFDVGLFTLDTEIGGNFNYTKMSLKVDDGEIFKNKDHLTYGAYGRVWLGIAGFMVAPQVKWNYLKSNLEIDGGTALDFTLQNMQYGAVLGYQIPFINLTPYVGLSYSNFIKGDIAGFKLKDTYAVNFGVNWKVPFLHLTIGFDGSYQKPKFKDQTQSVRDIEILTLGGTVGLIF